MKLKFKHQPFQAEAAAAVCDVFNDQPLRTANYRIDLGDTTNMQQRMDFSEVGFRNHPLVPELTRSRILENLRAVQIRNNLKPSDALAGPGINLTIEMETGTGKTYTYVKTMYELNRRYGWSKFIIVVPSVAIREGVAKSLETTQQHFSDEYGKKIRFFTYSSDKLTEVDNFASDSGIYAMIINMQAFNSSKNQKIIDKKLDSFRSRMAQGTLNGLERQERRLKALAEKRVLTDPLAFVQDKRLQLDYVQQKLLTAANAQWQEEQRRFAALAAKLDALSPLKVLGRGYAMARTEDGAVLRTAAQVQSGDTIHLRLAQGGLRCTVTEKEEA